MSTALITGSAGLIGSAVAERFAASGWDVVGVDNNMRAFFFGADGDVVGRKVPVDHTWIPLDIRNEGLVYGLFREHRFDAIVHCAGQPSHDWAADDPLTDFDVNARGTLLLLEAARRHCPEATFCYTSTNKVYGDGPNRLSRAAYATRFEFTEDEDQDGISEGFPVDHTMHSLFGCSKLAADVLTQEYARYFGMRTTCLRLGCITGAGHAAVPQHGFLSYLVKCAVTGEPYVVHGYGGKQVRDNLAATDLAALVELIVADPKPGGAVYNVGGGKENSVSILEAVAMVEELTGGEMALEFSETPRLGDHVVYYSDLRRVRTDYLSWRIEKDVPAILRELVDDWRTRLGHCFVPLTGGEGVKL